MLDTILNYLIKIYNRLLNSENWLYYNTVTQQYVQAAKITVQYKCNAITVKNLGTTLVIFDDEVLQPGQSKSFGGNRKEVFVGRKDLAFQTQTPPPTTIINLAVITQKYYMDIKSGDPGYIPE